MGKRGVPPAGLRLTATLPDPSRIISDLMSGNTLVKSTFPCNVTAKLMVSEPLLLPAAHSPGSNPDAVFVLAAAIASRKVHLPSMLFATSDRLLTMIVLPAGVIAPVLLGGFGAESRTTMAADAARE